jgi:AcrR family transcriptional regulator
MNREPGRASLPVSKPPAALPGNQPQAAPPANQARTAAPVDQARSAAPVDQARTASAQRDRSNTVPKRPSHGGGAPAQERELGAHGRQTVRRLLEAGLAEFDERGYQGVRVDDVVRRAKTSHGTFYLYFANKDDLFKALLRDALHDMEIIAGDFPVVTSNQAGLAALRVWVRSFSETYAAHATVIRILSQADLVSEDVFGDGLQLLFGLSEAIAQGMTAASRAAGGTEPDQHAELTALACLMMLERVNYLLSAEVRLPFDEMVDRLSAIIFAAFRAV